jgi:CubicO group peptidase (beta-lactamase class C family)
MTRLGFSEARLRRIETFLQTRYLDSGRLPCAQVTVTRGGETAYAATLGFADVERKTPCKDDTIFRIYSMTKPVSSIALMMLVEEGSIALEDPVAKYIPAWADLGVYVAGVDGAYQTRPPERPMQVSDLLSHTAGLGYGMHRRTNVDAAHRALRLAEVHADLDLDETIAALAGIPLEFSPGEAWNYSIATDVVGYLVQVVSGMPLQDFLRTRIFEPLKMVDTGFEVREGQAHRLAACYQAAPGGKFALQDDPTTSPYLKPPRFYSGGGGLVSTTADYLRFTHMLLRGGELDGARIISPRMLKLMTANHLPGGGDLTQHARSIFSESTNAGIGFGLGFAVVVDPPRTLLPVSKGEFYWGGAASTAFWVDPVEEICVVLMTQLLPSSTWPIRRELRTLVYSALMNANG